MSRFFKGDSDSESEEESSSGGEEVSTPKLAPSRFQEDSSSEEETKKRVVRSQKDKLAQEYESLVEKIRLHIKASECVEFQKDVDNLDKALQKNAHRGEAPPRIYFKCLVLLEDAVIDVPERGEKMSAANTKALNTFKSKIKKHNIPYAKEIAEYRASPDKDDAESEEEEEDKDSEDESEEESEEEDKKKKSAAKKPAAKKPEKETASPVPEAGKPKYGLSFFKKAAGAESSSSDSDDNNMSESESDDGSASDGEGDRRSAWVQKNKPTNSPVPVKKPPKADKEPRVVKPKPVVEAKAAPVNLTPEQVDKRIAELLAMRGKRATDRMEQIEQLEQLLPFTAGDAHRMTLLMNIVSAQFDASPSVATHMPANLWKGCLSNLTKIMGILNRNPSIVLAETEEQEKEGEEHAQIVVGNLLAYLERLDDEFIKGLQNIDDPHTHEYVQRLQDEQGFLDLTESAQAYYTRNKDLKRSARVAFRRMEHLYYKSDRESAALAKAAAAKGTQPDGQPAAEQPSTDATQTTPSQTPNAQPNGTHEPTETPSSDNKTATETKDAAEASASAPVAAAAVAPTGPSAPAQLINDIAVLIYAHGDDRLRARAMLMHIYYHALHDRFYEARDMMLMSHLQESIHHMDISTQILFNRAMVQLGLCAFRSNLIWEAHSCLAEICGVSRVKELLAQGVTTRFQNEKNVEQEKVEKKRQVPFHMHINLELLEVVHLVSAMLLEVPNMAANPFDAKRKVISRAFRRLIDFFDRQVFTGPPENNRDFVAAAAKALSSGNWQSTETLLFSMKIWALMPNVEVVKANVKKRIQEEGLRTYLFNYGNVYDSISLAELAAMFELQKNHVHSLVSKMMINEELKASWDQPSGAIVMHKVEPSKLQYLALQFAEKAAVFVENNERLLDVKTGGNTYNKEQGGKSQGQQKDRPWQEGGYRQPYNNYQRKPYNKEGRDDRREGRDNREQREPRERVGRQKENQGPYPNRGPRHENKY